MSLGRHLKDDGMNNTTNFKFIAKYTPIMGGFISALLFVSDEPIDLHKAIIFLTIPFIFSAITAISIRVVLKLLFKIIEFRA